jgi:hypothetical protein
VERERENLPRSRGGHEHENGTQTEFNSKDLKSKEFKSKELKSKELK